MLLPDTSETALHIVVTAQAVPAGLITPPTTRRFPQRMVLLQALFDG
jgi:hypothetical protein